MPTEIKLPTLGENVAGGDVVEVKVKPGDEVQEGQALLEVEAEKSSVEVPSPVGGRVSKVLVKKGDKVKTGQTLVIMEDGAAAKPGAAAAPKSSEASPPETQTEPEPPRAAKTAPPPPEKPAPKPKPPIPAAENDDRIVPAGPATRRLANDLGVNLAQVPGSGVKGRVTQDDIKDFVRQLSAGGGRPGPVAALPNFEQWGPVEFKALDNVRRKTAEHMALAWSQIPHVTHHDLADITDIESFRKQQDGKGPKITVTAFALKAAAIVLKEFPQFNASLDLAQDRLILKNYYHLGVAVDTERGLLVPVLRDVDKKSVQQIAQEMTELAERARQKKLTAEDMKGGTFTISNLGGIGGIGFSPIVNFPEVAILGLSRSRLQPVYKDGQWLPRLTLPLSLSYDHRVIDGAVAARFTRRLAEMLENPLVMLLHA